MPYSPWCVWGEGREVESLIPCRNKSLFIQRAPSCLGISHPVGSIQKAPQTQMQLSKPCQQSACLLRDRKTLHHITNLSAKGLCHHAWFIRCNGPSIPPTESHTSSAPQVAFVNNHCFWRGVGGWVKEVTGSFPS